MQHQTRHKFTEKQYSCQTYHKKIIWKSKLKRHIATHSGLKQFACELCGRAFTEQSSLQAHTEVVHDKIKNHVCNLCDKLFPSEYAMAEHMRVHTGEKPFKCHKCFLAFAQKCGLRQNMIVHK